jgi:hypothetical protein
MGALLPPACASANTGWRPRIKGYFARYLRWPQYFILRISTACLRKKFSCCIGGQWGGFSGSVETLYAKQAAEHVARHTTGVWRVDNQLRQRARGFPGDNVVADKIRDVFRRDAEIDERMIEVAVTEHHARLSGTV